MFPPSLQPPHPQSSYLVSMKQLICTIAVWAFGCLPLNGQADTLQGSSGRAVALPLAFLTPETSWGFGAAGIYTFRLPGEPPSSRPSQLQLGGAYTLEKQLLLYLPFQFFKHEERSNLYGELGYYRYTYYFYGVGNAYPDYEGELFDLEFPRVRLAAVRRPGSSAWYLGGQYWLDRMKVSGLEPQGLLFNVNVPGKEGGLLSAAGLVALLDRRDNVFYPSAGGYLELSSLHSMAAIGSDFDFSKFTLDGRKYWSRDGQHVVALNAYLEWNTGTPPFTHLGFIGGTRRMRGYYEGRFRDRQLAIFQAAYRFPLIWRFKAVIFAGLGNVAHDWGSMALGNTRWAVGAGLRFLLLKEERAHVRLDYGIGQNSSGVYITVGEAF